LVGPVDPPGSHSDDKFSQTVVQAVALSQPVLGVDRPASAHCVAKPPKPRAIKRLCGASSHRRRQCRHCPCSVRAPYAFVWPGGPFPYRLQRFAVSDRTSRPSLFNELEYLLRCPRSSCSLPASPQCRQYGTKISFLLRLVLKGFHHFSSASCLKAITVWTRAAIS